MEPKDLLVDAFGRVQYLVGRVTSGLGQEALTFRPDPEANTIAWLVWHLTRVQDDHIADAAGFEQVWMAQGWAERFGLPFDAAATGYGHSADEVGQVVASAELLVGYHDAVHEQTIRYVSTVDARELDRIVDTRWDPPVSAGVRLVSVIGDGLQHIGQAAYVKGLYDRRHPG
ncbi:MAG: hypothetical protein QOJ19_4938 [Acidimicrobiia bacterium]|nr:hypothetical protein [Acidimicrobiia bacterium]